MNEAEYTRGENMDRSVALASAYNKAMDQANTISPFMVLVQRELDRAYAKHGRAAWGRHEFYGIIKEEFDEMWADIKADAPQEQLLKEIVQVAAMCFRYFETGDRYRGSHVLPVR